MADRVQDNLYGNRSIIDSPTVKRSLIGAVSFLGIGLFFLYSMLKQGMHDILPYFLIAIGIVDMLLFRVSAKGYVVDLESGVLEFPGGGIKAQSWTAYLSPVYVFQEFIRHKVFLSEIREVKTYSSTAQTGRGRGRMYTKPPSRLDLSGKFGAISLSFRSEEKRDELYWALVLAEDLRQPALRRG